MSSTKTQFSSSNKPSQAEIQPGLEVDNPKMLAALVSEHSKLIMKIAETEAKKAVAFERVKDMRADAKQVEDIESMLEALITNPKFEARAKRGSKFHFHFTRYYSHFEVYTNSTF
jgi:hypothetical protein